MTTHQSPRESGEENSPCLIVGIRALRNISAFLYEPIETDFGGFVSIDELYFRIVFDSPEAGETLNDLAKTVQCDSVPDSWVSRKANSWRFVWSFAMGSSSVSLGIGWNQSNGKIRMDKGYLKFNPNKVAGTRELELLVRKVARFAHRIELVRYDVAVDIPCKRENVRMRRDRRGYEYVDKGRGITEYLGDRNKPGRVKLYDKTRKEGLQDGDWTRLELTASADWDAETVLDKFPEVYAWNADENDAERKWVQVTGLLLAKELDRGETIEPYLKALGRKSSEKVMAFLKSPKVEIDQGDIATIVERARAWESWVANSAPEQLPTSSPHQRM